MAVVNLKSTIITNRDATPKVLTDPQTSGGVMRESQGYITTNNGDSAGSTYRLNQVPSNARVSSVIMTNEALGAGCTLNVGVYYPTFIPLGAGLTSALASTAISATFFASGTSAAAAGGPTDIVNSATNTIDKQELPLWQAVGLTADPGIDLDIVAAVAVATAAAGRLSLKTRYCGVGD